MGSRMGVEVKLSSECTPTSLNSTHKRRLVLTLTRKTRRRRPHQTPFSCRSRREDFRGAGAWIRWVVQLIRPQGTEEGRNGKVERASATTHHKAEMRGHRGV